MEFSTLNKLLWRSMSAVWVGGGRPPLQNRMQA